MKFFATSRGQDLIFFDQMAISYGRRKEDWGNFRAWWEIGLGKKDSERLFKGRKKSEIKYSSKAGTYSASTTLSLIQWKLSWLSLSQYGLQGATMDE